MINMIYTGDAPQKEVFQIFNETISQLIEQDPDVVYIDADLMSSMRSKDLWAKYPNNVINTGIQEANMIGVAAGMYLYGKKTFVHSFAPLSKNISTQASPIPDVPPVTIATFSSNFFILLCPFCKMLSLHQLYPLQ